MVVDVEGVIMVGHNDYSAYVGPTEHGGLLEYYRRNARVGA